MQNIVHMKENLAVWNMFSARETSSKQGNHDENLLVASVYEYKVIEYKGIYTPTANSLPTEKYIAILSVSLEGLNQLEAPNAVWYRDRLVISRQVHMLHETVTLIS